MVWIFYYIFVSFVETDFPTTEQLDESTSSLKSSGGSGNLRNLVTIKPVDIIDKPLDIPVSDSTTTQSGIPIETVDSQAQKGGLDNKSPRSALRYIGTW